MRISVITPSFNQANFLEQTIESVISQKRDNFELEYIIIDGGSTDNSIEIIRKYESHFAYWVSEKDKGQSHAINKGFEKATGDIITWLNSDDQFTPDTLQKVAVYFQETPEIWLLYGKTILFGENFPEKIYGAKDNHQLERALAGLPFPQPSSFFRRELIEKYGLLQQELHFGMDYAFFLPVFLAHQSRSVDDVFSKYLYHNESKSLTQQAGFARDYARIFSKVLSSLPAIQSKKWIVEMQKLELYHQPNELYTIQNQFSDQQIEWAFYQNLMNQIIFYYEALEGENGKNWQQVSKIVSYLIKNAPHFIAENTELKQVYWRTKFLNPTLMKWLRQIKSKV